MIFIRQVRLRFQTDVPAYLWGRLCSSYSRLELLAGKSVRDEEVRYE